MKVGEKYQDYRKLVVITEIKHEMCWYEWDVGDKKEGYYVRVDTFKEWVRKGVYTLVPDKSSNFNQLYNKLRGQ